MKKKSALYYIVTCGEKLPRLVEVKVHMQCECVLEKFSSPLSFIDTLLDFYLMRYVFQVLAQCNIVSQTTIICDISNVDQGTVTMCRQLI